MVLDALKKAIFDGKFGAPNEKDWACFSAFTRHLWRK